jgi:hypothetical protein
MGVGLCFDVTAIGQFAFEGGEEVLAPGSWKRLAAVPIQGTRPVATASAKRSRYTS